MKISPLNLAKIQNQTQVKQNSNIKTNIPTNLSCDKFSRNITFGKEFSLNDNPLDSAIKDDKYSQRIERVIKKVQEFYSCSKSGVPESLTKMFRKTNETVKDIYIRKNENSKYINFKDLTIMANKRGDSLASDVCFDIRTSGVKFDLEFLHAKDLGDYIRTLDIQKLFGTYANARAKSEMTELLESLVIKPGDLLLMLLACKKDSEDFKKIYTAYELALRRNASQEKYDIIKEQLCKDYSDFLVEYMGISLEELEEENPDIIAKFITRNFNLDAKRGDLYIETYGKYKLTKGEMSEKEIDQLNEIIPPDIRTLALAMPNIKKASDELCDLDYKANGMTGIVLGNYKKYVPSDYTPSAEQIDLDERFWFTISH